MGKGIIMQSKDRFENLTRNLSGGINGILINNKYPNGILYTLDPHLGHIERAEAGEWGHISPLTPEDHEIIAKRAIKLVVSEVDRIINKTANDLGYKNIDAIAKYQGRNSPFSAQCDALGEWVDSCYIACFALQTDVENGDAELPSIEEVSELLPEFIDPAQ